MKKKDLLNITLPDVPEELIKTARNDEYMERDFSLRNYGRYTEKSYRTRLYFGASKADGILVVRMWSRVQLEKGIYDPISATYIDAAAEKWITRTDGSWSEAMLQNIKAMYTHQPRTSWDAEDVSTKEDTELCNRMLGTDEGSIYEAVREWQDDVRARANKKRAERRKADWDRMMELIPEEPEDFMEWSAGEGTINDNFLLYKRNGAITEVYCTHCGKTFETTEKMRHNKGKKTHWNYRSECVGYCRNCHRIFNTKSWRKQKYLRTESHVVLPQVAGEYISMQSFWVVKKFKKKQLLPGGPEKWEQKVYVNENLRVFVDPKTFESKDSFRWDVVPQLGSQCLWRRVRSRDYTGKQYAYQITSGKMYMGNADKICQASGMTRYVYERCQGSESNNPQRMLITMAKKKYLEYLFRSGLNRIAEEAVKSPYFMELNEEAGNLKDLLGVDGQTLRILKDIDGHYDMIPLLNEIKSKRQKVDIETIRFMNTQKVWLSLLPLEETGLTVQRMMNYLMKQADKEGRDIHAIIREYKDYLDIAEKLGYDARDEIISRTPDLKLMHDRYVEQYNKNKDGIRDSNANLNFWKIAQRSGKNAEHFGYEKEDLQILVPEKASDIIREGREQHHCVGANDNYLKKMNTGESFIIFLRKKEDLKKPYYTLEVAWDGRVIQSYGAYDRRPDAEKIDEWLRSFTRAIRKRTEKEQERTRVMAAV